MLKIDEMTKKKKKKKVIVKEVNKSSKASKGLCHRW